MSWSQLCDLGNERFQVVSPMMCQVLSLVEGFHASVAECNAIGFGLTIDEAIAFLRKAICEIFDRLEDRKASLDFMERNLLQKMRRKIMRLS